MINTVSQTAFAEGFDGASFLFVGVALLLTILAAQILWSQYKKSSPRSREPLEESDSNRRPESGADSSSTLEETEHDESQRGEPRPGDSEECEFDGEAIRCPQCSKPTEAEYRFCRHCAGDTGKSYVGERGDDGSSKSGMF